MTGARGATLRRGLSRRGGAGVSWGASSSARREGFSTRRRAIAEPGSERGERGGNKPGAARQAPMPRILRKETGVASLPSQGPSGSDGKPGHKDFLSIVVLGASGLAAADKNGLSDPYAKVVVRSGGGSGKQHKHRFSLWERSRSRRSRICCIL